MLEKTTYFFPLASLIYLAIFYFSYRRRKLKIKRVTEIIRKIKNLEKLFGVTYAIYITILTVCVILIFALNTIVVDGSMRSLTWLNVPAYTAFGYLLIKFSFAWIIVSEYEIHRFIDELTIDFKVYKLYKVELVSVISVFVFATGSALILKSLMLVLCALLSAFLMLMFIVMLLIQNKRE